MSAAHELPADAAAAALDDPPRDPLHRRYRTLRVPRFFWLAMRDVARLVRHGHRWPEAPDELSAARRQASLARLCFPDAKSPATVLLIVAHADDEALWATSLLRSFATSIRIVYVTDSAPRGDAAIRATGHGTRAEYALARREERRRALALASIGDEQVVDLAMTDQETRYHLGPLTRAVETMLDAFQPELVVTHAYEGGHPDHDATAYAVHTATRRRRSRGLVAPSLLEFAAYHRRLGRLRTYEFLPASACDEQLVTLDEGARQLKHDMRACFPSQRDAVRYFPVAQERFRCAPRYDFHQPPNWERVLFWEHALADQPNRTLSPAMIAVAEAELSREEARPSSHDAVALRATS